MKGCNVVVMVVALLAAGATSPASAAAHPLVDRGRQQYRQADFEGALDTFERALQSEDLTKHNLVDLYEGRALVHLAMGHRAAFRRDLERLAALDPDHDFGRRVPPEVVERFSLARERGALPPEIRVTLVPRAQGVVVRASVERDPTSLVRSARVHVRAGDTGRWQSGRNEVALAPTAGDEVQYYAEAVGPGGAVVARAGSRSDPNRWKSTAAALAAGGPDADKAEEDDTLLWVGVGTGAAAVVAAGVTLGVIMLGGRVTNETQPVLPNLER